MLQYSTMVNLTRSVAAGFGRHGMPPPASNDTGTALGQDGSDWSRDLATLTFDLGGHGTCGWCGSSSFIRIPRLKFVSLAVRKIWRTMFVTTNVPGDLDLWPLDLETGTRVASKVGNLPWKFGHARPLGSRIIPYVCDERTDRWTDKSNAYCPLPYRRMHNKKERWKCLDTSQGERSTTCEDCDDGNGDSWSALWMTGKHLRLMRLYIVRGYD